MFYEQAIINEGLFNRKKSSDRKKIVKEAEKYKSKLNKYNIEFNNGDTLRWFYSGNNNHYMYGEYTEYLNDSQIKNIKSIIKDINKECDGFYFKLQYENSIWVYISKNLNKIPTNEEYKKALSIANKLLGKYSSLKPAFKTKSYKVQDDVDSIDIMSYDTWDIKWSSKNKRTEEEYSEKFDTPFTKFCNDLDKELKQINLKLDVDGDEDNGIIYIKKLKSTNESYYEDNGSTIKYNNSKGGIPMSINKLANLALESGLECSETMSLDILKEYSETIESLETSEKVNKSVNVLPVYKVNEGYCTDMDTLFSLAESEDITLSEAKEMIQTANCVDTVTCALPAGLEKVMTLDDFCNMCTGLTEAGIDLVWDREILAEEFITEEGKISAAMGKVKDKINKMSINSLEKQIKKCEENIKKMNDELAKIDKMSKDEANAYAKKQSVKNIGWTTLGLGAAGAAGGAAGAISVFTPGFVGIPVIVGSLIGANKIGEKLAKTGKANIGFNSYTYKQAIKNTIKFNKQIIKNSNGAIKAKK